ncbi:MAG TPA: AmmeMemoRadiSam system radical SAM enzyme [candidate division WOR-3 bacterium]|uniref:AmmeMemoRadiSam system radical SAM enzyme n=1 Tax=candidate division WOR-3 bacterium TaxID=2052148 RepID=A0A7V0XFH3_UNCW3|nr:AmmeMemoRadiSam system radical SAM enzyme [candidate division WOR-3 bacterium]
MLTTTVRAFLLLALLAAAGTPEALSVWPAGPVPAHEARYYSRLERDLVRCELCPHHCVIVPGGRWLCRVRENRQGRLVSLVYGRPVTVGKEPVEKSPFFHFLPGTLRLTLSTAGCNQSCKYCQNWEISQARPEDLPAYRLPPDSVVALALGKGLPTICLTYAEPVVFFEYALDIARAAWGIKTAVVTGGYINPAPLAELCSLVDAVKIDLKGFTAEFYREVCGSRLAPVLEACRAVRASGTHLELVNLVVPGHNDDSASVAAMSRWIAGVRQ